MRRDTKYVKERKHKSEKDNKRVKENELKSIYQMKTEKVEKKKKINTEPLNTTMDILEAVQTMCAYFITIFFSLPPPHHQ